MKLKRILHVDDDDDIRTITKMTLEMMRNFDVLQFSSGHDVLSNEFAFDPQIFLLDIMMPEMSGEDLWRNLRALAPYRGTPTIFFTAKVDREYSEYLLKEGASAVVSKPFDPMSLCQEIEAVWQKRMAANSANLRDETGRLQSDRNVE